MKRKNGLRLINLIATLFTAILIFSTVSLSATTVVSAAEISSEETTTKIDDVVKNDKWIEMENELSVMSMQSARSLNPEARSAYILEKYDGAVASTRKGGISQRIQNGGWNVYYNTKNGKQTARTAYNGMFVAWSGNGGAAGVAAAWAAATGVGWIAGVVFGAIGGANVYLASLSKTCRDEIDKHGNTGTARMTLTEARWSKNYDNRW
ncbi:MAG: hypothetical protein Q6A81_17275 [Enterococcus casseliflavus]|nr:hypothetical protein [Enterococcus casseliflavus]